MYSQEQYKMMTKNVKRVHMDSILVIHIKVEYIHRNSIIYYHKTYKIFSEKILYSQM
jgi:hypothetical protein